MTSSAQRLSVKRGASSSEDVRQAVAELSEQISQPGLSGVIFFCSASYDLHELGPVLKEAFPCPVIGCTSAGELTSKGYSSHGIVGASLSSEELNMHPCLITPLVGQDVTSINAKADEIRGRLKLFKGFDADHMFSFILIDGVSMQEEQLTALVYYVFDEIPMIGGSAGDELEFKETRVYHDGIFLSDAAVVTVFETNMPFKVFISKHCEETNLRLVITEADPPNRIVQEINGLPAAQEYASLVGVQIDELNPEVFSNYPLLLRIGGQCYVRSIQRVNADGGLTFFCAIDTGLVLRIARSLDPIEMLKVELENVQMAVPDAKLILGCDCILRRLEIQGKGLEQELSCLLNNRSIIGFNTYGEQYNSIHVNQTMTGVAIGG